MTGLTLDDADALIESTLSFPDLPHTFTRKDPLTNFRSDGPEARILYFVEREDGERFVLKCKVQTPYSDDNPQPLPGPSEHTAAEIHALRTFTDAKAEGLPHLIAWKVAVQGEKGVVVGGYVSYVLMTLMPGVNCLDLGFWGLDDEGVRESIRKGFLERIKSIWAFGFEPYDCALRNILWDAETRTISLVDFEHWHITTTDPINMNETEEMQRWGIVRRPPASHHFKEWAIAEGFMGRRGADGQKKPADEGWGKYLK